MRRISTLIFENLLILFMMLLYINSNTYASENYKRTIHVVMDENYPPFSFRNSDGQLQGITIDEWKKFEQITGIKVEISGMVWSKAQEEMKKGKFDVIDTISYNRERAKLYDFSKPYANIDVPIFFDKSIPGITNVESLKGFVVGAKNGDNSINIMQQHKVTNIIKYPTAEEVVKAAKERKIHIFTMGKYPGIYYLFKYGIQNNYNYASSLYKSQFFRAVKKGNSELLATINDGFSKITTKEQSIINQRWFGYANDKYNKYNVYFMQKVILGMLIGFVIVLMLVLWNHSLRRKVEKKTEELCKTIESLNAKSIELSISEEKFRLIFERAPIGITVNSIKTFDMQMINQRYADIVGRTIEQLHNEDWREYTLLEDVKEHIKMLKLMQENKVDEFTINKRYIRPDGKIVWVNLKNVVVNIKDDENAIYIGMIEDITDRKQAEEDIKARENTFRTLFEESPDAVLILDNYRFTDCNPATLTTLGYSDKENVIGKSLWDLSPDTQPDGQPSRQKAEELINDANLSKHARFEWWYRKSDGTVLPSDVKLTSIILHDKQVLHVQWRDIRLWKDMEMKLEYLSYHDQLTGLFNRRFFEEEMKRLDIERNYPLTILMGDVNGLKLINDSFGHNYGDELLKKIANVLKKSCRKGDIVARLGGDEYVILLPKSDVAVVERIVSSIKEDAASERVGVVEVSISLGYETKYSREENIYEVFNKAEDHMYKKKIFESPSMRKRTVNTIIDTLYKKNKSFEEYPGKVSELCERMGLALEMPEEQISELKNVGIFHDIGNIAIDESIFSKPDKLDEEEWNEIKRHPEIGFRILSTINDMADMARCVLYHHERWDGTGYPKGCSGEDIPIQSRIVAIVATYVSITSDSSYHKAASRECAIEELKKNSGTQFDPFLIKIFLEKVIKS